MLSHLQRGLVTIIFLLSSVLYAEGPEDMLMISKTTSASTQQSMTPEQALLRLKDGNQRFLNNSMQQRDYLAQAKRSSFGQFPWAVVLNCMDSRSVPELVFDQGLADLFVLRVAGNVLNEDILGSMEFATQVVGSRLIVVLGHTSCGAMVGACEDVNLGHLTHVLDKIKPIAKVAKRMSGLSDCKDPRLVDVIAKLNASAVAWDIQNQSPIIRDLIAKGQVGIVTAMHNIKTGEITFIDEERFLPKKKN